MDKKKSDILNQMILKLFHDPDKFERIFAAQYLAKYSLSRSKKALFKALNDEDKDVVECIEKILKIGGDKEK